MSQSGKGSVGQPARIEAFWPATGDPYRPSQTPSQSTPSRAASPGKKRLHRKRAFVNSPRQTHRGTGYSPRVMPGQDEMIDLQELGRPLGSDKGLAEKKSPAGVQLTRHLEYDILHCIAKDRPEVNTPNPLTCSMQGSLSMRITVHHTCMPLHCSQLHQRTHVP